MRKHDVWEVADERTLPTLSVGKKNRYIMRFSYREVADSFSILHYAVSETDGEDDGGRLRGRLAQGAWSREERRAVKQSTRQTASRMCRASGISLSGDWDKAPLTRGIP